MLHAGAVHRMARREVVRAVENDITVRDNLLQFLLLKFLRKNLNVNFGIECREGFFRRLDFLRTDGVRAIENLALEVGEIDLVGIRDDQAPKAARREVERRRAAEAAGADDQRRRGAQPLLPYHPDLGEKDVAAVAEELLVVQLRTSSAWRWRRSAWCWRASAAGPSRARLSGKRAPARAGSRPSSRARSASARPGPGARRAWHAVPTARPAFRAWCRSRGGAAGRPRESGWRRRSGPRR